MVGVVLVLVSPKGQDACNTDEPTWKREVSEVEVGKSGVVKTKYQ